MGSRVMNVLSRLAACGVVLAAIILASTAWAEVEALDPTLAFKGLKGETIARTLNIRVDSPGPVTFIRHDLPDNEGHVLQATAIPLDPPTLQAEAAVVYQLTVSVTLPTRAGKYSGQL